MQSVEKENTSTNISILKPRLQLVFFLIGLIGLVLVSFLIELFTSIIARGVSPTDYDYEIFINYYVAYKVEQWLKISNDANILFIN